MLKFFIRSKTDAAVTEPPLPPQPLAPSELPADEGWLLPQSAETLLAMPRRQKLLTHIWQRTSVSRAQFSTLYLSPIERYAALVQQFPASEAHHHAYPGGMLDHGLEVIAYALKLRQSHLLPAGSSPEEQASQSDAWTAGFAYGALLHDLGKIAVDIDVETNDGQAWHPWLGVLQRPYRFRYRQERQYRLHGAAAGLLTQQILDTDILNWLSAYPELWMSLLYVLAGQMEHAGLLGELIIKADQASVAQAMGGDPARVTAAPKHALQRKLLDGLRYLIKNELRLNQKEASDGWLTDEALWLVSKTVADKLRAHLLSQGMTGIPEKNIAVFDVLQEHGIVQPNGEGKAIWSAAVMSDTGWSSTLTFLKAAPALIWDNNDRPPAFSGTVTPQIAVLENNSPATPTSTQPNVATQIHPLPQTHHSAAGLDALLDILGPSSIASPLLPAVHQESAAPTASLPEQLSSHSSTAFNTVDGPSISDPVNTETHFITWLRDAILQRKLIINDAKALVHTVADTVYLVSPGLFMRYAQEFPQITALAKQEKLVEWLWVQKRFEQLKLHRKQSNGLNIWTCTVTGPRKSRLVHGYLLTDPTVLMPDALINNPYLQVQGMSDTGSAKDE